MYPGWGYSRILVGNPCLRRSCRGSIGRRYGCRCGLSTACVAFQCPVEHGERRRNLPGHSRRRRKLDGPNGRLLSIPAHGKARVAGEKGGRSGGLFDRPNCNRQHSARTRRLFVGRGAARPRHPSFPRTFDGAPLLLGSMEILEPGSSVLEPERKIPQISLSRVRRKKGNFCSGHI